MAKRRVVLGLIGTVLDYSPGPARWEKWRPIVSICQREDLVVHRFELLYQRPATKLTEIVCEDIKSVSPETEVRKTFVDFRDPWDFEEVYASLYQFARDYFPAQLLQTSPPKERDLKSPGELRIIMKSEALSS